MSEAIQTSKKTQRDRPREAENENLGAAKHVLQEGVALLVRLVTDVQLHLVDLAKLREGLPEEVLGAVEVQVAHVHLHRAVLRLVLGRGGGGGSGGAILLGLRLLDDDGLALAHGARE